jgi:hypothetical protein
MDARGCVNRSAKLKPFSWKRGGHAARQRRGHRLPQQHARRQGQSNAWHDNEPSGVAALKVTRQCEFPTPGYPSSPATRVCMEAHVPFARLASPGYSPRRSREASRRKENPRFVSDRCPAPLTNHQQFIADLSRSLRCTREREPPSSKCGHGVNGERTKDARREM